MPFAYKFNLYFLLPQIINDQRLLTNIEKKIKNKYKM